ncbi:MAG: Glu-tRNA(Gln) amidotransferase subunit GatE [Candidatus Bathyarchaeia archaeon]
MYSLDYEALGLKVGLELHFQLATRYKLFCRCPATLSEGEAKLRFERRLRPTQSELGEVDPAALFEFRKGLTIVYEADDRSTCLVELDEEPPHSINEEAVDIALTIALLLNAKPVDEIHVMRKVVIDGSNTTGFQRTCVVALGGWIDLDGRRIGIQSICLEEDAARILERKGDRIYYKLDRLGIPLVEVSTSPDIRSPNEAGSAALAIGKIVLSTGNAKSELGSIRQDVNISIRDGALVEVKGIQHLSLIPKVVENEVRRQVRLLELRDEMKRRGLSKSSVDPTIYDVTGVFRQTQCKVVSRALESGGVVYALKLSGFRGLLSWELNEGLRFGTELADYTVFWGRLGGIFHTDELPAYGISASEVEALRKAVGAADQDAIVIAAGSRDNVEDGLKAVSERVMMAFDGVPEETRRAEPTGVTRYMRPRPGAARMYPETDIPILVVDPKRMEYLRSNLPELPSMRVKRYIEDYGLSRKLAEELVASIYENVFEEVCRSFPSLPASVVASTLTETTTMLRRRGVPVDQISTDRLYELFRFLAEGRTFKEAIPDILAYMAGRSVGIAEALEELKLKPLTDEELVVIISEEVSRSGELIARHGLNSAKIILGSIMKRYRGRVDASKLAKMIEDEVRRSIR